MTLSKRARSVAVRKMLEALRFHEVEVIALCVGGRHWHGLARFPEDAQYKSRGIAIPRLWRNRVARHFMGIAKKESARALSREGLCEPGGVWARGCGVKPIKDGRHFDNVEQYIIDHFEEGAAVWSERTGFLDPT